MTCINYSTGFSFIPHMLAFQTPQFSMFQKGCLCRWLKLSYTTWVEGKELDSIDLSNAGQIHLQMGFQHAKLGEFSC